MKTKNLLKVLSASLVVFAVSSCGGNGDSGTTGGNITAELLKIDGFNETYLPDTENIKVKAGKIDVVLDFDGNQYGWQKVADEYQRLHNNQVVVKINTNYSGTTYGEKLNSELNNNKTDWDICEGNLGYGSTRNACLNVSSFANMSNSYCGKGQIWGNVLEETAFKNVERNAADVYMVNSETMQSCWFVNKVALQAAGDKGYKNSLGEVGNPVTWDDLISLCSYMEEAGYDNPLGISLATASIKSLQFTWLLRIYGDYYYRQFYRNIMADTEDWDVYDPEATSVESFAGFDTRVCKVTNLLLDKETTYGPGFVGPTSEVYNDFISQLAKMKGHLIANPDTTEFNALRDQFKMQSLGKNSAQIMLDYLGNGLIYQSKENEDFQVDYFDYPTMVSGTYTDGIHEGEQIVSSDTITRDIGGNGGFLSIIKHVGDQSQNDLNLDFIKFYLSPYGQTLYYQGMSENGVAPKGLTTVKNELVVVPSTWKTFFNNATDKISFNGNVDGNPFISYGIRYFSGYTNTESCIVQNWRGLLMTNIGASSTLTVKSFATKWYDACFKDFGLMCEDNQWEDDIYKDPYGTI